MDMDRNYHSLNTNNYTKKKFTFDRLRVLESNLKMVDLSSYPDKLTETFYKKKIGDEIKTAILPNLLSPFQFEDIDKNAKQPINGKFRILLMSDPDDFDDINAFRETIGRIMNRVPEADVYVLSNNVNFNLKNPLRFTNYNKVPYRDMTEYYKTINAMNPSLVIFPAKKQANSRPYYKILEMGAFGIPMISMNEYPYNHLLQKDTHILIKGQRNSLVEGVRQMIDDPALMKSLSVESEKFVRKTYSFINPDMLNSYTGVFI